jgi:hypothetical protein
MFMVPCAAARGALIPTKINAAMNTDTFTDFIAKGSQNILLMHCYNFYHLFHTQFSSDRLFYIKGAMAEKYFLQIKVEDSDNTTDVLAATIMFLFHGSLIALVLLGTMFFLLSWSILFFSLTIISIRRRYLNQSSPHLASFSKSQR